MAYMFVAFDNLHSTDHAQSHYLLHVMQVSDVIDLKEDEMNPTTLTVVLSEERGHVYQFQTPHDLAVFRSAQSARQHCGPTYSYYGYLTAA